MAALKTQPTKKELRRAQSKIHRILDGGAALKVVLKVVY